MDCRVGDRVVVRGASRTSYRGTVRYIGDLGPALKDKGEFIGIELRAPHGTNDGRGFFKTKPKHALFVKRKQITEVIGGNGGGGASKYTGSAATNHVSNDAYMDDFHEGFEQLRIANGGSKTSSSLTSAASTTAASFQCGSGWSSGSVNKSSSKPSAQ